MVRSKKNAYSKPYLFETFGTRPTNRGIINSTHDTTIPATRRYVKQDFTAKTDENFTVYSCLEVFYSVLERVRLPYGFWTYSPHGRAFERLSYHTCTPAAAAIDDQTRVDGTFTQTRFNVYLTLTLCGRIRCVQQRQYSQDEYLLVQVKHDGAEIRNYQSEPPTQRLEHELANFDQRQSTIDVCPCAACRRTESRIPMGSSYLLSIDSGRNHWFPKCRGLR